MPYSLTKEETKINLEKMTNTVIDLKKKNSIPTQEAEVWIVMDISGSMSNRFRSGLVQKVVDRCMAIGMGFDANKQIDVVAFGQKSHYVGTVTENNLYGFADSIYRDYPLEGDTRYAEAIKMVYEKTLKERSSGLLGLFGKKREIKTLEKPIYVLFFTDGNTNDAAETTNLIKDLSSKGIFFQFIGLGWDHYNYLESLDSMSGRVLDNVNFFPIKDVEAVTDDFMLNKMMEEFSQWVPKARQKGMIK
jgi:vWA found in TerF C terminus